MQHSPLMMTHPSQKKLFTELTPQQFLFLPPQQRPLLIDVRTRLEYLSGHAPGAINLSLDRILLGGLIPVLRRWIWPDWLNQMPKDHPIAVVCLSAHRSPIAAKILTQLGLTEIFNLAGGMLRWNHLNLPIHKGWDP